jgi:hypothetical protein
VYSFYTDWHNSKTYSILPLENELSTEHLDGYSYYVFKNYAVLKDFETHGYEEDRNFLSKLSEQYNYILVSEFSDFDKYFTLVKDKLEKDILNKMRYLHYIKAAEIDKFDDQMIVQRFHRALTERKIRYFMFPEHPRSLNLIYQIQQDLGTPVNIESITYVLPSPSVNWIGFGLITLNLFSYIPLFSLIYILIFVFLKNWSFTVAATLFSIIIFFKISKMNLLKILTYSLLFGTLVYMSGYDTLFIFKLNNVRGVKILLVVLPLLVLFKAFMDYTGFKFKRGELKKSFKKIKNIKFQRSDIILVILVISAGIIYIIRSSNWAFVSNFERKVRDSLEKVLIARPRTKELISYLFYYTYPLSGRTFIWDFFKAILPVSILDTFLHIHTPLYLSLLRTVNGFLVSLILLLIIIFIEKVVGRFKISLEPQKAVKGKNKPRIHHKGGTKDE